MNNKKDNIMARGFDKRSLLKKMRSLRNIIEILQTFEFINIDEIASSEGTSRETAYKTWEDKTGKPWKEGLDIIVNVRRRKPEDSE